MLNIVLKVEEEKLKQMCASVSIEMDRVPTTSAGSIIDVPCVGDSTLVQSAPKAHPKASQLHKLYDVLCTLYVYNLIKVYSCKMIIIN